VFNEGEQSTRELAGRRMRKKEVSATVSSIGEEILFRNPTCIT